MIAIAIFASIVALIFAGYFTFYIVKRPLGTPKMIEIYQAIRQGSKAYLKRQYKTISIICAILALVLFLFFDYNKFTLPLTAISFLLGAFCSIIAGYVGMDVATRANVRAAFAAKTSSKGPLRIGFYGGMVMGLFNIALSLLGITILYFIFSTYGSSFNLKDPLAPIVGFGFGASLSALFAQLGGGIYTKAADVGADLVGKVEAGIPEDDPRNPAVIADLVGDNVGDIAGRGADLFESTAGENLGAMILGAAVYALTQNIFFLIFPLLARAVGIFCTIFGVFFVRGKEGQNPFEPLRNGVIATVIFCTIGFYILIMNTLHDINLFYAGMVGLASSIFFLLITQYYTDKKYRPVQSIAHASKTGVATNIITGFSVSLESTALPVVIIVIAVLIAYHFGTLFAANVGWTTPDKIHLGGIYGTAVATMGILSVAGIILGLDGFGPIADNAGGIAEMSHSDERMRKRLDPMDAVGNTTKALTKGYAMASAGLAAMLLFQAYLALVHVSAVDIIQPKNIAGIFIGVLVPFVFASFAIRAVGNAAFKMVEEVRRQFKAIPGLLKGKGKPDYSKAIDISTLAAQKEMILPGLLALLVPIAIGFVLGVEATGAFLMGATISGFIVAMMMNTGGAAFDNAKKFIESGFLGGKGSEAHKAAVVGDTFGDPMKDTAGPSLHVLIKLINTISLVFGPLFLIYAIGVI